MEHDLWCGDMILKESYPNLFGISCIKDTSIVFFFFFLMNKKMGKVELMLCNIPQWHHALGFAIFKM